MEPLLLSLPFLLLISPAVQAQQNITLGSSLAPHGPNSSWLSPSGDFMFGFQPVEGNSSYLIAIWLHKIRNKTVVWYAKNNDPEAAPVQVSSGSSLHLTSAGTLSALDPTGKEVWNPQVFGASYASMLDTGNFLLAAVDGSTIWQTFDDDPTNTLLLTTPKVLRSRDIATSYSNGRLLLDQPAVGSCSLNSYSMLDANNQFICVCPAHYSFVDEESMYKSCKPDFRPQRCDLDDHAVTMQFQLISMENVDWPFDDYEMYTPITKDKCQQLCLRDCFCAVAVFRDSDKTCWKKKMPSKNGRMGDDVQRTVFIKVPKNNSSQSELVHSSKWKKDKKYWILVSSLFLVCSILVNLLLIYVLFLATYRIITRKEVPPLQPSSNLGLPLKAFTYAEFQDATNGFEEVVGTGASGIVYKGNLQNEPTTCIAVKKLDKIEHEIEKEFTIEVQTIGRMHHKNLVRLLGFCNEGKERLLVYEFMTNGSLNRFLFGDVRLQWNIRVQLALGVARGLLYLHEECSAQIIHCDIKPQNVLLDENFTAKISDFGLAKLLRTKQTQTNTGIRGTRGYVAPEWFKNIGITSKVDVYSFGVILLELICCRRNVELEVAEEDQKILTYWAMDCYRGGRVDFLVEGDDEAMLNLEKVERFVKVALWCLQEDPTIRPTMLKVTQMLDGATEIPAPADPSSFVSSHP
ncbi:hypothetical protein EJB05_47361 [Eragrostis curvula]|uniref:non-specific serine/threonine protein kinase n=1 Tax=Eragrostis curvula TaxID=38414 RepID=A0A5J9T9Q1_9POAL|nr:hypothetical protein EJB05_47361 [Eragrostis curvula]